MSHVNQEDLVLYLYGEADAEASIREHLHWCRQCRGELSILERLFAEVDRIPVPERPPDYGERVWRRLEPRLDERAGKVRQRVPWLLAVAALMLAGTFLAGRFSIRWTSPGPDAEPVIRERVLLVALDEHLERSQLFLLEVANRRPERLEVAVEPETAIELLRESRLYRQTARHIGNATVADVLEELERALLDIAHGPDSVEAREALRNRLDDQDLLFKIRVLRTTVQHRQDELTPRKF